MHSLFFNCSAMGSKLTLWMTLIKCKKKKTHVSFHFCRLEVGFIYIYIYIFVMSWIIYSWYTLLSYLTVLKTLNMMVICTICKIYVKILESGCVYIVLMHFFFLDFFNLTGGIFPRK